jgi:hypothetical protein
MKNRLEYKYLVPLHSLDRLRRRLLIYLDPDSYAAVRPANEYTVRSVYFDSYDYRCYYEKLDGIHTRRKFRIRGYNEGDDTSTVYFEIKRKLDNFISKDRAGMSFRDIQTALAEFEENLCLNHEDRRYFNNFCHYYQLHRLEPKVLVVYEREPFECKFGSKLRITFDKNLRSRVVNGYNGLFEEKGLVDCYRKEFILEVKFFQVLPQWISRVLEKFDITRIAVSKYVTSIDTHHCSTVSTNKLTRYDFIRGNPHVTEPAGNRSIFPNAVPDYS